MRIFEFALLLSPLPWILGCFFLRGVPGWWGVLPAIALVAHAPIEGLRWPFAPAYCMAICLAVVCCYPRFGEPGKGLAVASLLLVAAAATGGLLLPVFRLPSPTGPYQVGTVIRHLVDNSREDVHVDPTRKRELLVQIWYPASGRGPRQPYRSWREVSFKTENLALVKTHSSMELPLADSRTAFPIILFAPSWEGRHNQCTAQVEELASQGFVVIGLNHPYSSVVTAFPDGRTVHSTLGPLFDFSSDEAAEAAFGRAQAEIEVRVADVRFLLDQVELWSRGGKDEPFAGHLAAERIGVYGYSFGGAVAARVAREDPRVKVAANLDGAHFDRPHAAPIGRPFLFYMSEETYVPGQAEIEAVGGSHQRFLQFLGDDTKRILASMTTAGGFTIKLNSAHHANFCDSPLYTPVRRLTGAGPIPPRRAMKIINAYLCAFFRQELHGSNETLLHAAPAAPEVEIEHIPSAAVQSHGTRAL